LRRICARLRRGPHLCQATTEYSARAGLERAGDGGRTPPPRLSAAIERRETAYRRQDARSRWGFRCAWFLAAVCLLPGCEDKRRHQAAQTVSITTTAPALPADATAEDVARTFLNRAAEAQQVRQNGLETEAKRRRYDEAFAEVCSLIACDELHHALQASGSPTFPKQLDVQAATILAAESWVSMLAYYADGIRFDTLRVDPFGQAGQTMAIARVDAARPQDVERLAELMARRGHAESRPASPSDQPMPAPPAASADIESLRELGLSLDAPLFPPVDVRIELRLRRSEDGVWRVLWVTIGPATSVVARAGAS